MVGGLWQDSVFQEYGEMTDEDVAGLAKEGDKEAVEYLLVKYKKLVSLRALSYFLKGASREDIVQEGMIGLYKAILDYRPEKVVAFHTFAEMCITRRMLTAIKTATRQKHGFLNSYISLDRSMYDDDSGRTLLDVYAVEGTSNPEDLIIRQEELAEVNDMMSRVLTDFELRVVTAFLDGKSYRETAEILDCNDKAVDNALQRVKKKLHSHFQRNSNSIW